MSQKSKRRQKRDGGCTKTILGEIKPQWKGKKTEKNGDITTIILEMSNGANLITDYKRVCCIKCHRLFWAGKHEYEPNCPSCVREETEKRLEKMMKRF